MIQILPEERVLSLERRVEDLTHRVDEHAMTLTIHERELEKQREYQQVQTSLYNQFSKKLDWVSRIQNGICIGFFLLFLLFLAWITS